MTSSSVRLQWDAPAQRHRNGIIVLYEVMYRLKDNYIDDWTTNSSDPWIVIEGLEPDEQYQFQVRAYTGRGGGPWSDPHLVHTLSHSKQLMLLTAFCFTSIVLAVLSSSVVSCSYL